VTGWGVVERDAVGGLRLVAFGTLRPKADAAFSRRLRVIHEGLLEVVEAHAPEAVAVEEAFAGLNVRSAIRLGEARAVCVLAAELSDRAVHELSPALVKKVVAGHGQAGKESVRNAVMRLLGMAGAGEGDEAADDAPPYDAADALALAIAALTRLEVPAALRPGPVGRRARRRGWTLADVERLTGEAGG
jgi:crossover junction endodeoxyribonuclease RuvC